MTDLYTKCVLTVIAIALCVIAGQGAVGTAKAQLEEKCGQDRLSPCWIMPSTTIDVFIRR